MLEIRNLTKTFGDFKALDDLSMTVPKGTVYGLVGPNGAGKSTAIRCMVGVYRPDSGSVTMNGEFVYENPDLKARIGYIPDEIFYFPAATLEEMRRFYKGIYPDFDDNLFERLYEIFSLPRKTPIRRFSKGMQKQAAFVLCMAMQPETMVLDEPIDGLRVNAIAPGFLLTNQNRALLTNPDGSLTPRSHTILEHTPYGRFLEPDELVGTLQWLASYASKAVSGTVVVVDGGFDAFSI